MIITVISRKLGLDRRTVNKALKNKGESRYKSRTKSPSIAEPLKPYIHKRLEDYDLGTICLLEEIEDQGYTGKYTIVKNYVRSLKKDRRIDAVYRFQSPPGEQVQVDWGEFDQIMIDGDTQTFIQCHLNDFAFLGGYARTTLDDNLKQVVLTKYPKTGQPKYNPLFENFARHYKFKIRLCRAYRPQC